MNNTEMPTGENEDQEPADIAVQDITIRLDSTDGPTGSAVYRPGQMVTGRVRLRLLKPLPLRNLDLLIQGSCIVSWGQGGGHFVRDDEVYLNDMAELVPTGLDGFVTLSAGEHVFPFACSLPQSLPATFKGNFGSVAYTAKAVMQAAVLSLGGPWVTMAQFAVESELPPADNPELLSPCQVEVQMAVGNSRNRCVKATLLMPRRVFTVQDDLVVNVTVSNQSRKTIASLSLRLIMDCVYQAGGEQFKETLMVADWMDEYRIGHMEDRCLKNLRLKIPRSVPPSGLPHCHLINLSYAVVFQAEVEDCPKNLNLRVPVFVGLAPVQAGVAASAQDGKDPAPQPVEELQVMHRLSREPSITSDTNSSLGDIKPIGSTEKQLGAGFCLYDPSKQPDSLYDAADPNSLARVSAASSDRNLPTEFNSSIIEEGENLY